MSVAVSGRRRVYIGRLPSSAATRDVERFFRKYGRIREVDLKQGYGFVEFDHTRDAEDAVHDLDGTTMDGCRVLVQMARDPGSSRREFYGSSRRYRPRNPPPERSHYRLIIKNLSSRVSWQDLKDLMRKAGEVCYADAHRHKTHEAIVEFLNKEDMYTARDKYDNYDLKGRKLEVAIDSSRRGRSSRSRSHSSSEGGKRKRGRRSHDSSRSKTRSRSQTRSSRKSSRTPPSKKRRTGSIENGDKDASRRDRSESKEVSNKSRSRSSSDKNRKHRSSRSSSEKDRSRSSSSKDHGRQTRSRDVSHSSKERDRSVSRASSRGDEAKSEKSRSFTPEANRSRSVTPFERESDNGRRSDENDQHGKPESVDVADGDDKSSD